MQGHPVLIDFGTVWPGHPSPEADSLEFELGTMPYRAPELLFGSRSYSPFALDIWSFGALIAEFYTPMERSQDASFSLYSDPPPEPSVNHPGSRSGTAMDWYSCGDLADPPTTAPTGPLVRKSLFEGSIGDIGLVGSIFKILGTPDSTSWPEAKRLPDFSKLNFHAFPKQDLRGYLPALSYTLELAEQRLLAAQEPEASQLRDQIKVEKQKIEEQVLLIERFLSFQSTARIDAFRKTFFPQPPHSGEVGQDSSWLWRHVEDENQICSDAMEAFFLAESEP